MPRKKNDEIICNKNNKCHEGKTNISNQLLFYKYFRNMLFKLLSYASSYRNLQKFYRSSIVECNRGIHIGAFNVKVFGSSKIEEFLVKEYLVKVSINTYYLIDF